jgi:Helix-turn-helix domain
MWSVGEGGGKERFLADLRALRDAAALELDEVAARAHYPSDVLKEAENGPSLPGLPILAAYVRACDGDVPEWEERWRRLGFESRADPSLPVRPAGASPAAVAGARAAVSVAPPDVYDPDRIRAALRGSHARSDPGSSGASRDMPGHATGEPRAPESPAAWSAGTSWDGAQRDGGARWDGTAADLSGAKPNGNHHVTQPAEAPPDLAVNKPPDSARADAIRRDPFSTAWLQDGDRRPPAEPESRWADQVEAGPQAADEDSWFTPREKADGERTGPTVDVQPSPAAADNWFSPRERADSAVAPPRPAEPDVVPPQEHTGPAAAGTGRFWTPPADVSLASDPPGPADRTTPIRTPVVAAAPSRTTAGPAVPPGPVVPQRKSRSNRLYPMRLLVIIVVAALIGSILVLLLR